MDHKAPTSEAELKQLFQDACEKHEAGLHDKAAKLYCTILEQYPDSLITLYNYGLLLLESGDFKKALYYYQKAVKISPSNTDVLYNYALCQKNCGDIESSITTYQKILQLNPDDTDSLYNLGGCYKDQGENEKGIECYLKVLKLEPKHPSALNNVAYLYHKEGRFEQAKLYYSEIINNSPDNKAAKHMLASLSGVKAGTAPKEYVTEVFDNYSSHYERSLVDELKYCVPKKMNKYLVDILGTSFLCDHILDLGCGTGLAGVEFRRHCRQLTGLDLSEKMLREAERKSLYDKLFMADINEYLQESSDTFDMFIAADVFTYLGELGSTFDLINSACRLGGIICFSTEFSEEDGYTLRSSGRFAHSISYIRKLTKALGWHELGSSEVQLRQERGTWIDGTIFVFKKDRLLVQASK